ncbi:serine/threonine-protein kinase [Embleya hyalina]|uniref:non-specific serine/threonine protein kinase n=1 Tax=Embleya hyalina TaxID=516124 RepID=A0A401Z0M7_9ACTN|nr:serine/threonine-protein kinase [Embleya hyalina]GCE00394.1 serine/threonine protein kinase [Embleya hyalina]
MDPLKPGDPGVVGRYRLSARLGRAGLGTVFLGRAPGGEQVAVKLVRSDLAADKKFLERFRTDMAAAREVGGTHVAHVLDADADGTPPWLVVEHVAGPSLEAAVEAHGAFPERTLRALGAGLAEGLAAVHEAGLTHRDLKPANVLLAADGPRVADYALARALGTAGLNRTGVVEIPGLPAPEQVTGGSIGPAIDVFALGGVLCHAAGVAPFGTGSAAELAQRVVRETPDLTELPDWLREIVADCLKKRPTARPDAADLVARFAAADPATDWLPKATAALLATHAAEAASASAKRVEIPDADEADTVEPGDADGADADGSDPAEEPETAEVAASAALATPAAAPAVVASGAKATKKTKPRTGTAAARKTDAAGADDEADRSETAADDTEAKPARPAAEGTKAKPGGPATTDGDADDATPVTTPAIRGAKPGRPTAAARSAADTPEDDATPVATPAARGGKAKATTDAGSAPEAPEDDATPVSTPAARGGKAKPATEARSDTDDAEDDATPVATPAARGGKAKAKSTTDAGSAPEAPEDDATPVSTPAARGGKAKPATEARSDADDAENDATPVANPAARGGKAKPATEARSDADDAEDDATPVATPAVRGGKAKPAKPAAEAGSDVDDAEDDATTPVAVPAARDDKPKGKAGAKGAPKAAEVAEDDVTTPVAVPAVRIGKDEDDAPAADPAPESGKPEERYDGGAPVKVPVIRRGGNAETVKVPRKPDGPAPAGAGAETVKVPHPAASPVGATTVLPAPAAPIAAPPHPTTTPAAAATAAPQPGSGIPFPLGLTEQRPTPEQRPANPLLWHAVIALLGVTAVGIGLFRLTDSAWRDAQNMILGVVLPGISVLAGLAGLGTLVLAVVDARKPTPQGAPPLGATPQHLPAEADSPR